MMVGRGRTLLALVLLASASGCYHYIPVESQALRQGTPLRAQLTRPTPIELPALTVNNTTRVDGEFIQRDEASVFVSALWLDDAAGSGFDGQGWTVAIPVDVLGGLQVRRFSRWRTAGVFAVGLLATYLGFDALGGGEGSGCIDGTPSTTK